MIGYQKISIMMSYQKKINYELEKKNFLKKNF
jgi:hypothetical protein